MRLDNYQNGPLLYGMCKEPVDNFPCYFRKRKLHRLLEYLMGYSFQYNSTYSVNKYLKRCDEEM
jgi:hypothetical protein